MKKTILFLIFILCFQLVIAQEKVDYLINNVSIVPMVNNGVMTDKDVAVKDGKIQAIVKTGSQQFNAQKTIDGKGKFLMPALSDAHVHLPKDQEEYMRYLKLSLINGVTRLRSMRGTWKDVQHKQMLDSLMPVHPKLYLSAPPIYRNYDLTTKQLKNYVKATKNYGFDFIKILSVKNDTLFRELDQYLAEKNIPIASHFPKNLPDELIFNSQIDCIEHLGGLINVDEEVREKRLQAIKQNNIYIDPTMSWNIIGGGQYSIDYMKNQRGMEYTKPEVLKKWTEGTQNYRSEMGEAAFETERKEEGEEMQQRYAVVKKLNKMGVNLLISPDASSKWVVPGFGILEEMKLYKKAGLSNYDILRAATLNFARYWKETDYGSIETGKNAEFILLEENPLESLEALESIQGVFHNANFLGKVELNKMAKGLLPKTKTE